MSHMGLYTDCDCALSLFCCDRDLLNYWRRPWRDTPLSWRPWRGRSTHANQWRHNAHIKKALLIPSNLYPEVSVGLWLCPVWVIWGENLDIWQREYIKCWMNHLRRLVFLCPWLAYGVRCVLSKVPSGQMVRWGQLLPNRCLNSVEVESSSDKIIPCNSSFKYIYFFVFFLETCYFTSLTIFFSFSS